MEQLIKEHNLDPAELEQRLLARRGQQYNLNGATRRIARKTALSASQADQMGTQVLDVTVTINARTSVAKLFKLVQLADQMKARAEDELTRRPPDKIEPVKKAVAEIELLRREMEKIEAKIQDAQGAWG